MSYAGFTMPTSLTDTLIFCFYRGFVPVHKAKLPTYMLHLGPSNPLKDLAPANIVPSLLLS